MKSQKGEVGNLGIQKAEKAKPRISSRLKTEITTEKNSCKISKVFCSATKEENLTEV